jgi:hypothetical protein
VDSADSGWGQLVSICERDNGLAGFAEDLELLGKLKASTDGCYEVMRVCMSWV